MFCKNCGEKLDDFALTCPKCGAATAAQTPPPPQYQQPTYQQPQYQQPTYQQPQYQQQAYQQPQYQQQYPQAPVADVASGGLKFLAFCFPIVGLILYFVWKDQKPMTAKAIIKLTIIGFIVVNVVPTILYIIFFIVMGIGASTSYNYGYHIVNFASRFFMR